MSLIVEPDRLLEIARMVPWIEGVSEGHEAPCCEFVRRPTYNPICDRPAEWSLRSRCCGSHSLGCDPHVTKYMASGTSTACTLCDAVRNSPQEAYSCTRL